MEDNLLILDEVEVTAKPNINEIDVREKTGNVSVVLVEQQQNTPVSSIELQLQGKTSRITGNKSRRIRCIA